VVASQRGEGVCYGVGVVVFGCCGGRGRDKTYGEACTGGLGHNDRLPHCPLGPCRGDVNGVVA